MQKVYFKSITIPTFDSDTGELKSTDFVEQVAYKSTKKGGWTAMYKAEYDKAFMEMKSELDKKVFIFVRDSFTKTKIIVEFNQSVISKRFKSTPPTINKIFRRLEKIESLLKVGDRSYMFNPYMHVPAFSDGLKLQKEWDKLKEIKESEDV